MLHITWYDRNICIPSNSRTVLAYVETDYGTDFFRAWYKPDCDICTMDGPWYIHSETSEPTLWKVILWCEATHMHKIHKDNK
jgi:hypothetical protein